MNVTLYDNGTGIDFDPIKNLDHDLFFDLHFPVAKLKVNQTLQHLCDWANTNVRLIDTQNADYHTLDFYTLLVRINLWINDIRQQGIVKPFLVNYTGNYTINTGESRLRCLEVIENITHVRTWITAPKDHAHKFQHLTPVKDFRHFADICRSELQETKFDFSISDRHLDWYDYNDIKTGHVMFDQEQCINLMKNYIKLHPEVCFSLNWFANSVDWSHYENC